MKKGGCIYRRGQIYWIAYYVRGKQQHESTKSEDRRIAEKLLLQREIEADQDKLPNFKAERTKWDAIAEDYLQEYRITGLSSLRRAIQHVNNLRPHFGGRKVHEITSSHINEFIDKQIKAGRANGTINRQLSALRRMFNIGAKQTPPTVLRTPHIRMLKEDNVREGFFEHDEFMALRAALPAHLKAVVTLAYFTGMRKAEILGLKWDQVDFKEGTIRLSQKDTKTKQARTIPLNDEIWSMLTSQKKDRDQRYPTLPFCFYTPNGEPIESFRKAWISACKRAGLQGRIFHDFRRTAVRNMVRSGVPERVAMMVSGHRTRSIFDRYNIVSEEDLRLASKRVEAYTKAKMEAESPFTELEELGQIPVREREGR